MSLSSAVNILHRTTAFGGLGDDRLNVLAFSGERLKFSNGECIAEAGSGPPRCVVVLEGKVQVQSITDDGTDCVVGSGATIGEIALITNQPLSVTLTAESTGEVLIITRPLFERMVEDFPDIAVHLRDSMRVRLSETLGELQWLEKRLTEPQKSGPDRNGPKRARGRKGAPNRAQRQQR